MSIVQETEYITKATQLFQEAKTVLATNPSAEDFDKAAEMVKEAEEFKAKAESLKDIRESADTALQQLEELKAAAPSAPASRPFKYWGSFLEATYERSMGVLDPRLIEFNDDQEPQSHTRREEKSMSGRTGASGGVLIPEEFRAELYAVMAERTTVRRNATVIPMRRRSVRMPSLDQTGVLAGMSNFFGGMEFFWEGEEDELAETDAKWRDIELVARKLTGYTRTSQELLDDSAVSLEAFLSSPLGFAGGAAWKEDYAFLQGDGVGKPLGILNASATILATRAAAGNIGYIDLLGMLQSLLPSATARWIASQATISELMQLEGPSGHPSYLWGSAADGVPTSLLGRPIEFTEKLPALGSKGDILLSDLSYYLVGDREAASVDSTPHERFKFYQVAWRMIHRVDGKPWLSAPITLADGSTTVSPFVALNA